MAPVRAAARPVALRAPVRGRLRAGGGRPRAAHGGLPAGLPDERRADVPGLRRPPRPLPRPARRVRRLPARALVGHEVGGAGVRDPAGARAAHRAPGLRAPAALGGLVVGGDPRHAAGALRRVAADARARRAQRRAVRLPADAGRSPPSAWWRTPRLWTTAVAGLVLGAATLVRIVGEPTVAIAVLFLLLAATTWRARLTQALVVVVAFAVPLTAYAAWYHQENGAFAITQASGRALYMRTTTFVDCSRLTLPSYEQTLCPGEPLGDRLRPDLVRLARPEHRPQPAPAVRASPRSRRCGTSRCAPSRRSRWTTSGSSPATPRCRSSRCIATTATSTPPP